MKHCMLLNVVNAMLILSSSFVLWCLLCFILKSGHDGKLLNLNSNWLDPSSLHPDRFVTLIKMHGPSNLTLIPIIQIVEFASS